MFNLMLIITEAIILGLFYLLRREVLHLQEQNRSISGRFKSLLTTADKQFESLTNRIEELEKGLNPNYEAAKKANDALNDFNKGVAAILGYDPYAALHKDDPVDE